MVPEIATETQMARSVARKAGLRRGTGSATTAVIADFIGSAEQPLARQWLLDLTEVSMAYFYSNASTPIYLFRSDNLASEGLDPGDYEPFMDSDFQQFSSETPGEAWRGIWSFDHTTAQRLTISTTSSRVEMRESLLDGPFAVLLQVV